MTPESDDGSGERSSGDRGGTDGSRVASGGGVTPDAHGDADADADESLPADLVDADESLPADLVDAVVRLCKADTLLVAMDFDGTLAPLVPRADDARPLPASAAAFAALADLPGTTTALISGRALASLRSVATPPGSTLLIGSHGAEVWLGPDAAPLQLDEAAAERLDNATSVLKEVTDHFPGTSLEHKPAGVVLHTRQATPDTAAAAVDAARTALSQLPELYVTDGKQVLEVAVVRADKGDGIRVLREATGATAVLFAGDDVTDEDGFGALGPDDLGVKVGDGHTRARYRIGSPEDVPALLQAVLAARKAIRTGRE
ncbi:MAG: haloacid dehalogenase [Micrococcaceae bacterium]|nr:haloacid dehalogenase [Micrococcaceae bacterium]